MKSVLNNMLEGASGLSNKVSAALDVNTSTLSGAIDVIVVRQPDGSLRSTPFHVRFGKLQLLKPREKLVSIEINAEAVQLWMKLGYSGEAFFLEEGTVEPLIPSDMTTPPVDEQQQQQQQQLLLLRGGSLPAVTTNVSDTAADSAAGRAPSLAHAKTSPVISAGTPAAAAAAASSSLGIATTPNVQPPPTSGRRARGHHRTPSYDWQWGQTEIVVLDNDDASPQLAAISMSPVSAPSVADSVADSSPEMRDTAMPPPPPLKFPVPLRLDPPIAASSGADAAGSVAGSTAVADDASLWSEGAQLNRLRPEELLASGTRLLGRGAERARRARSQASPQRTRPL